MICRFYQSIHCLEMSEKSKDVNGALMINIHRYRQLSPVQQVDAFRASITTDNITHWLKLMESIVAGRILYWIVLYLFTWNLFMIYMSLYRSHATCDTSFPSVVTCARGNTIRSIAIWSICMPSEAFSSVAHLQLCLCIIAKDCCQKWSESVAIASQPTTWGTH